MLTVISGLLIGIASAKTDLSIENNTVQNFYRSCLATEHASKGPPPKDARVAFDMGLCTGAFWGFGAATVADHWVALKHDGKSNMKICVPGGTKTVDMIHAFNGWMAKKGSSMDRYKADFVVYRFFVETYPCNE